MVTGAHLTQEIWQEALSAIRERINGHSYETWFKPLTLDLIEGNRARVSLPNSFFKEWFEEHYLDLLRGALEDLVFTKVDLELVIPDAEGGPARQQPGPREPPVLAVNERTRTVPGRPRDRSLGDWKCLASQR